MTDALAKYGLHIDDMCKIRLLEPQVTSQSEKLRLECEIFVESKYPPACFCNKASRCLGNAEPYDQNKPNYISFTKFFLITLDETF